MTRSAADGHADAPHVLPLRPPSGRCLVTLLEGVIAETVATRRAERLVPVAVTLDATAARIEPAAADGVRAAVGPLLAAACEAAASAPPRLREVVVTVVATAAAVEVEVADSGSGTPPAAVAAVRPLIERLGGGLTCGGCPEGGLAVTLTLPHHRLKSRAA